MNPVYYQGSWAGWLHTDREGATTVQGFCCGSDVEIKGPGQVSGKVDYRGSPRWWRVYAFGQQMAAYLSGKVAKALAQCGPCPGLCVYAVEPPRPRRIGPRWRLRARRRASRRARPASGLGQLGGADWRRVYQAGRLVGWAYARAEDASMVSFDCEPAIGLSVRAGPLSWWETVFGARRPSYSVPGPTWFYAYNRPTRSFAGWYYVGWPTARAMARCPNLDVFSPGGTPVAKE